MEDAKTIIKKALKPWLDKAEVQAKAEFEKLAAGSIDKIPMKGRVSCTPVRIQDAVRVGGESGAGKTEDDVEEAQGEGQRRLISVTPVRPLERGEILAAARMWEAEQLEVYGSAAELPEAAERLSFFEEVVHPACDGWWAIGDGTRVLAILGLKDGHIAHLYVDPEVRGCGLGRQLVEHSKAIYPARLTVDTSERVTGFYTALGFVKDETAEDEVRMVWQGFAEGRLS